MTRRISSRADTLRQEAIRLADLWQRLSALHIAFGCTCSASGVELSLEDFERDIADYLVAESVRTAESGVRTFLEVAGPLTGQDKPVRGIFARLCAGEATPAVADWLLSRMARTVESYAQLHGPAPEALFMGGAKGWGKGYRT
jgi:hypothetical protein